jgi:hypothetical protein
MGPSSSSGHAMFSLTGKVLDSDTRADVAAATIRILNGPNQGAVATTDTAGNYGFPALQQVGRQPHLQLGHLVGRCPGVKHCDQSSHSSILVTGVVERREGATVP